MVSSKWCGLQLPSSLTSGRAGCSCSLQHLEGTCALGHCSQTKRLDNIGNAIIQRALFQWPKMLPKYLELI